MDLVKVVEVAAKEVGVREVPANSNRGPRVEAYQKYVGAWLVGGAWCAAFVSWCFGQVFDKANPVGKQSSAIMGYWTRNASREDFVRFFPADVKAGKYKIEPGDLFVLCSDVGKVPLVQADKVKAHTGHIGICDGVMLSATKFGTIEGNTNTAGSREGGGVYHRSRSLDEAKLVGFVRYIGKK
jgi:hypothetical protein